MLSILEGLLSIALSAIFGIDKEVTDWAPLDDSEDLSTEVVLVFSNLGADVEDLVLTDLLTGAILLSSSARLCRIEE